MTKFIRKQIKNRVKPKIFYKWFYEKPKELKFNKVELPKINRKFK